VLDQVRVKNISCEVVRPDQAMRRTFPQTLTDIILWILMSMTACLRSDHFSGELRAIDKWEPLPLANKRRKLALTPAYGSYLAVSCFAMREQVQKALDVLIGKSLWSSGRAADLEWFSFGGRRTVKGFRGVAKEVGEYALHVHCAWRIRRGDQVVVGSRDLYVPPEGSEDRLEDFNWDVQGANRRDKRIAELFQNETRQFVVKQVQVGEAGSFTVILEDEYALDVFPDDSLSDEHWRIFRPSSEAPHFVLSGSGLPT
jgi:hypothetical protein